MNTNYIISSFVLIPILGFIISLIPSQKNEKTISTIAFFTASLQLMVITGFLISWIFIGGTSFNIKELYLYQSKNYEFLIDLYFDKITAVYLFIGAFVTFLITRYSAYYMHMEDGYKRFFNTILLFFVGFNLTVLSGNFETLFVGWEVLGISSFLLIAFYRDRYLPVRNAVKVFSVYRIGDIGILLAMWASHHLWHENITFNKLNNFELVHVHLTSHSLIGVFISLCVLIAAVAKSAQFPFSYWLPRAMEGPTPSSAIFYGSLSVHFGVFLLLRTFPFWQEQISVRIFIGLVGLTTALTAYSMTQVQSTIKTQIAYASITQIGLMFIEIAIGLEIVALIHFAGNALLRTYQLLVSPSVVSYMIRDQFYNYTPDKEKNRKKMTNKLLSSIYILSVKEWGMDKLMNRLVFTPFKKAGRKLNFLTLRNILFFFIPVYLGGVFFLFDEEFVPVNIKNYLPVIIAFIGLILVFKSFSERQSPVLAWLLVLFNHFFIALAVSFNEHFDFMHTVIYLSGISISGITGYFLLMYLKKNEKKNFDLHQYYGHSQEYRNNSLLFLLSALGLMGFPITMSFIGEDLIFSHIHQHQYLLAIFYSLSYVLGGIALIRIYARLYLGAHIKTYHETPLKSS